MKKIAIRLAFIISGALLFMQAYAVPYKHKIDIKPASLNVNVMDAYSCTTEIDLCMNAVGSMTERRLQAICDSVCSN